MPKNKIYRSFLQVFAFSVATSGFGLFANTNIQAARDIVWVTTGSSIGKYSTDGKTAIPNFITVPLPGQGYATYLGGILVSGLRRRPIHNSRRENNERVGTEL